MELIPVIDLLGGQVVRAIRGQRDAYRPLRSALCDSSDPQRVAQALLGLYPFGTLYIADLDAILGQGDNLELIANLRRSFPATAIWVDAGITDRMRLRRLAASGLRGVVGSERLHSMAQYRQILPENDQEIPLSLDFGAQGFLGPPQLLEQAQAWPRTVICMTLGRVGSMEGPDFDRLAALQACRTQGRLFAAGGIRNLNDLLALQERGIAGALVASALHDKTIVPEQLYRLRRT